MTTGSALTSSFQSECVVLTDMVRRVRPDIPVLFLETFHHFAQTLAYRDEMTAKYGEGAMYQMPASPADIANPVLERTRAGTGNIYDFKDFSPRLGLAYVLTDDRRTVLRAHVGRLIDTVGQPFGPRRRRVEKHAVVRVVGIDDRHLVGTFDRFNVRTFQRLSEHLE